MQSATMKGLFRRYVVTLAGLVSVSVLTVGSILALYHYSKTSSGRTRSKPPRLAPPPPPSTPIFAVSRRCCDPYRCDRRKARVASRDAQASDFRDALKFEPAILNIRALEFGFRETNFVSRLDADRVESGIPQPSIENFLRAAQHPSAMARICP